MWWFTRQMGMRRTTATFIAALTALLLPLISSCGDGSDTPTTTGASSSPSTTDVGSPPEGHGEVGDVSLTRSGGIAGGFVMIVVQPDGTILRSDDPDRAPAATGETVPPSELEALRASVGSQAFAELDSTYVPPDLCCDQFHYEVTAEVDGKVIESVTADGVDAPDALDEVVQQLNAMA